MNFAPYLESRTSRDYKLLLLAIIAISVLARLFHFHLTIGSDDQRWIIAAQELGAVHSTNLAPMYYSRILWRCVLAVWGAPWGLSLESSAVLMFLLSSFTTLMIAEATRLVFGWRAALLAAAIYATHPLNVTYDVVTLPAGLGVALLATSVFFFFKYLQAERDIYLGVSAFLTGLAFSVKEYFVLLAVPLCAFVLLQRTSRAGKRGRVYLLVALILLGISVDLLLHLWESHNPFNHIMAASGYGDRLLGSDAYTAYIGWRQTLRILADRLFYVNDLFFDFGGVAGFISIGGLVFLALQSRVRQDCQLLLGATIIFFLFLTLMPARLHPFRFVEIQTRYLTVLLPFLAIGSGAAIAAILESMRKHELKMWVTAMLVLACCYNLVIPNDGLDRYRLLEFVGIRNVLKDGQNRGIGEIVLPKGYNQLVPNSYYSYGVKLAFLKFDDELSSRGVQEYLQSRRGRAVFIPRVASRQLEELVRVGDYEPRLEAGKASKLWQTLETIGFQREDVRVPQTSFRSWLDVLGIRTKGQLVGWVYMSE